ncbi:Gfo/Idh/MocA family protein [Haloplanus rubicundus]|uniref:Gfo/Idh/MocA family oxidoreductase n=1 Tax=Haloplanus rubicundus TaxID=1547898 RepID=A0A345EHL4_9EURY|nr:Gfo/Idh/MocA family oxidoreductase [Haloplanus rubicundus]AXG11686.1 gfo/Idh/MocA family oxidoreductase [Haloplanus rubicundus]
MLRTAIVGLGAVASWHEIAIERTSEAELVAVADVDGSRVERVAARTGVAGYTDLGQLLHDEPVDWVHVCTPIQTHYDVAMRCVDHGVDVLVEKPFVRTREEFERLTAAADRAGVRATVVHNQVYYPSVIDACRRIERGEFGRLHGVSVQWAEDIDPRQPDRGDWVLDLPGGEFGEGIVHPIYVGLRAAGYPADESAVSVGRIDTTGDETVGFDGIAVSYTTADDVACTIQHHSNVPDRRRIDFAAERAHVTADVATGSVRVQRDSYGPNASVEYPALRAAVDGLGSAVRTTIDAIADAVWRRVTDAESRHDTHSPVIQREAAAICGRGDGPTPRAEADWANRLFIRLCDP